MIARCQAVSFPSSDNRANADITTVPELVELRCLGQTELKVKPGAVGTTSATKPANLGVLDYAHLRAPLPSDLGRSGIFVKGKDRKFPDAYFLMRRSSDGYVSASGMFKAAFPYSSTEEEAAEKEYIKTLPDISSEEIAGNLWIHPDQALTLADEYGLRHWITALLDPAPITRGSSDSKKNIKSPPAYKFTNGVSPSAEKKKKGSTRAPRSVRSESPVDTKTAARKIATPRKRGKGRAAKADEEHVNGDTVRVEVETKTEPNAKGDEEVETTKVNVEMPADSPKLDLPQDAESMLKTAREMVAEAEKIGGSSGGKGKRKAKDQLTKGDEEPVPAKKAKVEVELKKERIKRRALGGIAASVAIGYVLRLYH